MPRQAIRPHKAGERFFRVSLDARHSGRFACAHAAPVFAAAVTEDIVRKLSQTTDICHPGRCNCYSPCSAKNIAPLSS